MFSFQDAMICEEDTKSRRDVMQQTSTAARFKSYVDSFVNSPESRLILRKDDSFDDFQNKKGSLTKFEQTDGQNN